MVWEHANTPFPVFYRSILSYKQTHAQKYRQTYHQWELFQMLRTIKNRYFFNLKGKTKQKPTYCVSQPCTFISSHGPKALVSFTDSTCTMVNTDARKIPVKFSDLDEVNIVYRCSKWFHIRTVAYAPAPQNY